MLKKKQRKPTLGEILAFNEIENQFVNKKKKHFYLCEVLLGNMRDQLPLTILMNNNLCSFHALSDLLFKVLFAIDEVLNLFIEPKSPSFFISVRFGNDNIQELEVLN